MATKYTPYNTKVTYGTYAQGGIIMGGYGWDDNIAPSPKVSQADMALAGIALGLNKKQVRELRIRISSIPRDEASLAEDIYEVLIKIAYDIKQENND